jgi:hypothetical protein
MKYTLICQTFQTITNGISIVTSASPVILYYQCYVWQSTATDFDFLIKLKHMYRKNISTYSEQGVYSEPT